MTNLPALPTVELTDQLIADLDLAPDEVADFQVVLRILMRCNVDRVSIRRACTLEGFNRSTLYLPKWQRLLQKANTLIAAPLVHTIQSMNNLILEHWPDLVNEAIRLGLSSVDEKTRLEAIKFLFEAAILPQSGQSRDETPEQQYLKSAASRKFDPLQPIAAIQAQAGSTINIIQAGQPATTPAVIEGELVHTEE